MTRVTEQSDIMLMHTAQSHPLTGSQKIVYGSLV